MGPRLMQRHTSQRSPLAKIVLAMTAARRVVASPGPSRSHARRVGGAFQEVRVKKPRLGRGLKFHLPEGNKPIACTTGRVNDARFRRSRHQVLW
jgi:hypothetical protein